MKLIFILLVNVLLFTSLAYAQIGDPVGDINGVVIDGKKFFRNFIVLFVNIY